MLMPRDRHEHGHSLGNPFAHAGFVSQWRRCMKFRTLVGIALITIGTWVPSKEPAAAQSTQGTVSRIAYESCYFDNWDTYDFVCSVAVLADGIETIVAPVGYWPKWSPDGGRIVFFGDYRDPGIKIASLADLSVYNVAGQGFDWSPAWSPDGSQIAFASDRTGAPELFRVNADGTGLARLTTAIGFNGRFAWSPDGRTIALARDMAGVADLYRMNVDGSSIVRLTSGLGGVGEFEWSPDSKRLLFDCATEVCVINADATGFARLTTTSGRSAVFAPGDGRIAFVTTSFGPAAEIAVRQADGTIVRVAAATPGTNPVWSPDGTSLMFEGTNPFGYEGCCFNGCNGDTYCLPVYGLYTVDATGSNLRLLGKGSNPDWLRARPGQPLASFTYNCTGSICDFDATGSSDPDGAIVSYVWRFGDATSSTGSTIGHTYTVGGTFNVTLTVTDDDGTATTVSRQIVANAPPTASFAAACATGMCTYNASGSADPDGTIASYEWTFGDGTTLLQPAGAPTATHSYRTGTFIVQLVVRDNAGASATASTTVQTVNNPPTASFVATCDAVRCTFDASASADPEGRALRDYFWNFGDGWGLSGVAIQHTYATPGSYRVVLTVVDDSGQYVTAEKTITVKPGPLHIGDLDGTSTQGAKGTSIASVTVVVHDGDHRRMSAAYVVGRWSTGDLGACYTEATGQCTISTSVKGTSASFTIQTIELVAYVYAGPNHDPDGDSNGTTITLKKR
jgi:PKD repeat protein